MFSFFGSKSTVLLSCLVSQDKDTKGKKGGARGRGAFRIADEMERKANWGAGQWSSLQLEVLNDMVCTAVKAGTVQLSLLSKKERKQAGRVQLQLELSQRHGLHGCQSRYITAALLSKKTQQSCPRLPKQVQYSCAAVENGTVQLPWGCQCRYSMSQVTMPLSGACAGDSLSAWSAAARLLRGFHPLLSKEAQLAAALTMQSAGERLPPGTRCADQGLPFVRWVAGCRQCFHSCERLFLFTLSFGSEYRKRCLKRFPEVVSLSFTTL